MQLVRYDFGLPCSEKPTEHTGRVTANICFSTCKSLPPSSPVLVADLDVGDRCCWRWFWFEIDDGFCLCITTYLVAW